MQWIVQVLCHPWKLFPHSTPVFCWYLEMKWAHQLRQAFHVCVSISRKVVLVHLPVTIFIMRFCLQVLYPHAETPPDEWLFCAYCPYRCNTHMHEVELVKTMKCLATTKRIPWFRRCISVCMEYILLLQKRTSGNAYMESRPYPSFNFCLLQIAKTFYCNKSCFSSSGEGSLTPSDIGYLLL